MSNILHILPSGVNPNEYNVDFYFEFPPFPLGVARGSGWVTLYVELPFKDGITRRVQFVLGKEQEVGGYRIEVLFKDSSLLEFTLVDKLPPVIGRVTTYQIFNGERI